MSNDSTSCVAAVLLAAGRGRRFGTESKLLAGLGGKPLVRHVAETASASLAAPIVAVTGFAANEVRAALHGLPLTFIDNPDYATGMASSLKAGIAALPATTRAALILLGDMPCVSTATLDMLIARFADSQSAPDAIVPLFEGQRGNPVLIGRALFTDVAKLTGDEGARRLLGQPEHCVMECPVGDPGVLLDVDTPEAYERLDPSRLGDQRM